jgi:hypothetical protein
MKIAPTMTCVEAAVSGSFRIDRDRSVAPAGRPHVPAYAADVTPGLRPWNPLA